VVFEAPALNALGGPAKAANPPVSGVRFWFAATAANELGAVFA